MAGERMTVDEANAILENADRRLCAVLNELLTVPSGFLGDKGREACESIEIAIDDLQKRLEYGVAGNCESFASKRLIRREGTEETE
jgi:hypothetical protein